MMTTMESSIPPTSVPRVHYRGNPPHQQTMIPMDVKMRPRISTMITIVFAMVLIRTTSGLVHHPRQVLISAQQVPFPSSQTLKTMQTEMGVRIQEKTLMTIMMDLQMTSIHVQEMLEQVHLVWNSVVMITT